MTQDAYSLVQRHDAAMTRRIVSLRQAIDRGSWEDVKFAHDQIARCWDKIRREARS